VIRLLVLHTSSSRSATTESEGCTAMWTMAEQELVASQRQLTSGCAVLIDLYFPPKKLRRLLQSFWHAWCTSKVRFPSFAFLHGVFLFTV
jgi:hypothetical protein